MNDEEREQRLQHFVEEMALGLEREGLPRMVGRVAGHLLVCSPAQQSSADIAEALSASRGAISHATRTLLQVGIIQRSPRPGSRATYFEIRPDAFDNLLHAAVLRIRIMREVADRGLDALDGENEERSERLRALRDMYAFMEDEYPKMLQHWDEKRKES